MICASVSPDYIYIQTGIDVLQNSDLTVYPNPASTQFSFLFNHAGEKATVSLVDVAGRVILSQSLANGVNVIDIHQVSKGAYFLITGNDGKISSTRVFISQ